MSEDPYADAATAGIHRLAIPTPFAVGRVNLYLIDDEPLTLVDAGPNSGSSLDQLQRSLEGLGYGLDDLERLVITHQHIDHIGLVDIVATRSGAEVLALDRLVPFIEHYQEAAAADDEFASREMRRHGIPDDVVDALQSVSLAFRAWGSRASVSSILHESDSIEFADRSLEVLHRPGHSPTDTVFFDARRRMLIGGDHLIAHISSNPLIARPVDGGKRPQSLVTYIQSLRMTRVMDLDIVLPGHGDPVRCHRELIDARLRMHARRADKIFELISKQPCSAYEIAQSLWGNIAVTQAFLTLSEVLGHTDILVNEGRVAEQADDLGRVRFEAIAEVSLPT